MFKSIARRAVLAAAISAVAFGTMGFQSNDGEDRFADGDELIRYRINVCEITEYRYTAG